ncbi:MAG: glycoside hydrolase family 2, partial [Clostridia bacterium]|nr:glycoside hydrolase family 2 [Clostridia bacterium]
PSIILWAGDNEVDDCYTWQGYTEGSNRYNAVTREAAARAVRENDPYRPFLPSSPYIDIGVDRMLVPEQHNWGPRAYFKDDFYRLTRAHFVSECGYHGCPAKESLQKFIPDDELWPISEKSWKTHNAEYRTLVERGYDRNELMAKQVRIMVGEMPKTLDDFILFSQFTQAEAKKYFIESTRIHKWRRTGIIWWNMIDGWPQISDAVVDWYYVKKRAFNAIQHVQTPICIMLDEHDAWGQRVILGNDSRTSASVSYRIIDADTKETLLEGNALSPANENITLGEITILPGAQKLLLIEWTIASVRCSNHYLTGHPPYNMEKVRFWAKQIDEWNND